MIKIAVILTLKGGERKNLEIKLKYIIRSKTETKKGDTNNITTLYLNLGLVLLIIFYV
jgi:hypothetical protein